MGCFVGDEPPESRRTNRGRFANAVRGLLPGKCEWHGPEQAGSAVEKQAKEQGIAYRLFKIPMEAVMRASTLSETRGFLKALVETDRDRILGFTAVGVGAAEIMTSVQLAMGVGLAYTTLRDAILTHPTLVEGLIPLFSSGASTRKSSDQTNDRLAKETFKAARD
jgi:hypothetical protein